MQALVSKLAGQLDAYNKLSIQVENALAAYRSVSDGAARVGRMGKRLATGLAVRRKDDFTTTTTRKRLEESTYRRVFSLLSQVREAMEIAAKQQLDDEQQPGGQEDAARAEGDEREGERVAIVRELGVLLRDLRDWSEESSQDQAGRPRSDEEADEELARRTADTWMRATDPATGSQYYYHRETRQVQWEPPWTRTPAAAPPPPALPRSVQWSLVATPEGQKS